MESKWVVEYSPSQNMFHLEQEIDILTKEIRAYEQRGWIGDYKVIGRFDTREEASRWLQPLKIERDNGRKDFKEII